MVKGCIILIILTHLLNESWVLLGNRSGNTLVTFLDGKSHGVIRWWFVKGLFDQLLNCVYCFAASTIAMKRLRSMAMFFWILFIYHAVNMVVWLYNYSTNRYVFYVMLASVIVWAWLKCWPTPAKVISLNKDSFK